MKGYEAKADSGGGGWDIFVFYLNDKKMKIRIVMTNMLTHSRNMTNQ